MDLHSQLLLFRCVAFYPLPVWPRRVVIVCFFMASVPSGDIGDPLRARRRCWHVPLHCPQQRPLSGPAHHARRDGRRAQVSGPAHHARLDGRRAQVSGPAVRPIKAQDGGYHLDLFNN